MDGDCWILRGKVGRVEVPKVVHCAKYSPAGTLLTSVYINCVSVAVVFFIKIFQFFPRGTQIYENGASQWGAHAREDFSCLSAALTGSPCPILFS